MTKLAISRVYDNPTWRNIETKESIEADIFINYNDGSTQILQASIGKSDDPDSDWMKLLEVFTIEDIDERTTADIQKRNKRRDEELAAEQELEKRESAFRAQEVLFAAKLEAFEIPVVKASTNREIKALIRKSKSISEVNAYTAILIMKEMENAQQSVVEEPPSGSTE